MYLSRLILNQRNRAVRRDLADCQALHRTVMAAFPEVADQEEARARLGVLYRLERRPRSGEIVLLIQSRTAPDWARLPAGYLLATDGATENPAQKTIDGAYERLGNGQQLVFRLLANPTRKIDTKTRDDGRRRHGRRVELRGEEAQVGWLQRKAAESGFQVLAVRTSPGVPDVRATSHGKVFGRRASPAVMDRGERQRLTLAGVLFEGRLRITDVERFRQALARGIGPGKAYGFGLLSVAPVQG